MSATITTTPTGYTVQTADGCSWQKYSLAAALDFCRILGFKPTYTIHAEEATR